MKYILAIVVLGGVGFVLLVLLNQPRVEEARAYREMGLALQQQALVAQLFPIFRAFSRPFRAKVAKYRWSKP